MTIWLVSSCCTALVRTGSLGLLSHRVDADCVYFAEARIAAPKGEKRWAVTVDGNIGAGKSTVIVVHAVNAIQCLFVVGG